MTEVWITIAALAVITAVIKATAPVALGGRPLPDPLTAVIALLAPALLAALVIVETFADEDRDLVVDERVIGVAAGAAVLAGRGNLVAMGLVAAAATAIARALF